MKTGYRLLVAALWLLLAATPALAQPSFTFYDESGRVDRAQVERAAQPLINRGALVAVYMVNSGGESDFSARLLDDGLLASDGRAPLKLIAVYVDLANRQSYMKFGEDWNEALAVDDNYKDLLLSELNPALAAGNFTQGFVDVLGAVEEAIVNPPGNPIVDTAPIAIGGVVVAGAGAAAWVVSRRRRAAKTLASAKQRAQEARQGAGGAIAAFAQRFDTAKEKAKYDKVSYAPADVAALAREQDKIAKEFAAIQNRFDDIGERLDQREKPEIAHFDEATAAYSQVTADMAELSKALDKLEARRAELDKLAQQAPEEINRAKKA